MDNTTVAVFAAVVDVTCFTILFSEQGIKSFNIMELQNKGRLIAAKHSQGGTLNTSECFF